MDRNNRYGRKKRNNWNNQKNGNQQFQNNSSNNSNKKQGRAFIYTAHEDIEAIHKKEKAIQELKGREVICPKCGQPISDLANCIADKASGNPMHFECVMTQLSESEKVGENEKIAYIGQGRFAVLYFENPRDQRHFTIKKVIEWEERDKKYSWRDEISSLYSQVE